MVKETWWHYVSVFYMVHKIFYYWLLYYQFLLKTIQFYCSLVHLEPKAHIVRSNHTILNFGNIFGQYSLSSLNILYNMILIKIIYECFRLHKWRKLYYFIKIKSCCINLWFFFITEAWLLLCIFLGAIFFLFFICEVSLIINIILTLSILILYHVK